MKKRKGIILAGGSGTRLYPITLSISKQLLPIYDKPMIYYPISTLMLAGIREVLIITTPHDKNQFIDLLGNGSQWGISIKYESQPKPEGLAQAFIIAEDFLELSPSIMVLGDNIFFGHAMAEIFSKAYNEFKGASVFGYHVSDPERYGVVEFDNNNKVKSIIEKPKLPRSNYAVTGLYFVDETAPERAKKLIPSSRGELEIISLLETYLRDEILNIKKLDGGITWLDTGTHNSLLEAGNFVKTIIERQGLQVGSPDEIAYKLKYISKEELKSRSLKFKMNDYGKYISDLIN